MKKTIAIILSFLMLVMVFTGCSHNTAVDANDTQGNAQTNGQSNSQPAGNTDATKDPLKIGVSYPVIDTPWTVANSNSFVEAGEKMGMEVILTNAENSAEKQFSDIEDLISRGCDVIYIYAVDTEAIAPAIDAIKDAGKDCVIFNRVVEARTAPDDYAFTCIGDAYQDGEMCGSWLAENYKNYFGDEPMKVIHLTGPTSASDANLRGQGFLETLDKNFDGEYEVVATQNADWLRVDAQKVMQNLIQSTGGNFNVVYAHNNEMALGAIAAMKQAGIKVGEDVIVVTIDTTKETVQACIDGDIEYIVAVPPVLGEFYFQKYLDYLDGTFKDTVVIAPHAEVTRDTAEDAMVNGIAF